MRPNFERPTAVGENPTITGPGWDFGVFWNTGRAILAGHDPYAVFGSFYPPAATILFAIFALLPFAFAYGAWTAANVLFIVKAVGIRKAPVWLLYFPILSVIAAGQVDLALVALATLLPSKGWKSVAAAALITLKPQVALLLLPYWLITWLISDRRRLVAFVGVTLAVQGWPLLIDPTLFIRWIERVRVYGGGASYGVVTSPGVWSLPVGTGLTALLAVAFILIAIVAALRGNERITRSALVLATPFGHEYDGAAIVGAAPGWLLVPLSWLTLIAAHTAASYWPLALIPAAAFIWNVWKHQPWTKRCLAEWRTYPSVREAA